MEKEIRTIEVYEIVNGITNCKEVIEIEVDVPSKADLIAEKEAELLKVYAEIQDIKNNI